MPARSIAGVLRQHYDTDTLDASVLLAAIFGFLNDERLRASGRFLGNFPQALSHLALIEAAGRIILAERIQEIS